MSPMTPSTPPLVLTGGCHCQAVRFTVTLAEPEVIECNCSICTMKGFVHLIVPHAALVVHSGLEAMAEYRFHTRVARHTFCRVCGIHPFYVPRSHPDEWSVNANCLDDRNLVEQLPRVAFDGRNWEDHIHEIV